MKYLSLVLAFILMLAACAQRMESESAAMSAAEEAPEIEEKPETKSAVTDAVREKASSNNEALLLVIGNTPPPAAEESTVSVKAKIDALQKKLKEAQESARNKKSKASIAKTASTQNGTQKKDAKAIQLSRYPTVEAPDEVKVQQDFSVQVSLTEDLITPEVKIKSVNEERAKVTADGQLSLTLPEQKQWKLDVILSAPGFKYLDGNTSSIRLGKQGDSMPAMFKLQAKSISKAQKTGKLYVTFWHKGVYLAKVMRDIQILNLDLAQESEKTANNNQADLQAKVKKADSSTPRNVDFKFNLKAADLTVFVLENLDPERPNESQIIINSPYLQPRSQTYYAAPDVGKWIDSQYDIFTRHSAGMELVEGMEMREQTVPLMKGFGRELYQKFAPALFKEAYWTLKDKLGDKFRTIQVFTNNPHLPWELMRPSRADGSDEQNFISINHRIGRWHISQNHLQMDRPPQSLSAQKVSVIAPQYGEQQSLPGQIKEIAALKKLRGYQDVPADFKGIKRFFTNLPQGIIHFSGHGEVKEQRQGIHEYSILLNDSELNLSTWKGLVSSRSKNHPFFFFNACKIGQSQRVANVVNGWAPAVLDTGASGYVGALWPVSDNGATDFGIQFYTVLERDLKTGSATVADALQETRKLFFQSGDPSYLSYIFYGDPNLEFVKP